MIKLEESHSGVTQGEFEWGRELDMIKTHCMSIHRNFSRDKLKKELFVLHLFFYLATRRQHRLCQ